jgi:hypothetical protein
MTKMIKLEGDEMTKYYFQGNGRQKGIRVGL